MSILTWRSVVLVSKYFIMLSIFFSFVKEWVLFYSESEISSSMTFVKTLGILWTTSELNISDNLLSIIIGVGSLSFTSSVTFALIERFFFWNVGWRCAGTLFSGFVRNDGWLITGAYYFFGGSKDYSEFSVTNLYFSGVSLINFYLYY